MIKRVVIGVVVGMSFLALWQTSALAGCIQYFTIGGTAICVKWTTKGVRVEVEFKQECGIGGENCSASASATSFDSIAFCQQPGGGIVRRECTTQVTFTGNSFTTGCESKHPQDGTTDQGVGHEHHGCTATFVLTPSVNTCSCQPGETLVDLTPIEMTTTLEGFTDFGGGGDNNQVQQLLSESEGPGKGCSSGSSFSSCVISEQCSINPKRIALNEIRPYQCNVTGVENGGFGD
jgi:hypothetical protein